MTGKVTETQQQQNHLAQQVKDLNHSNLRHKETEASLDNMLETQIKLDKKITEVKECQAEIRQLKLKLFTILTEKQLQTLSLNSPLDFYNPSL